MFKKKPPIRAASKADVHDDLAARRDDLQGRLSVAEDRLKTLRADAVAVASSNPDALPALSEQASRAEFEIAALTEALRQAEQAIEEAAEAVRLETDKAQREATSHELRKLAVNLEKAVAPVPDDLEVLRVAIAAVLPIIGPNGFPDLLGNLRVEKFLPPVVDADFASDPFKKVKV